MLRVKETLEISIPQDGLDVNRLEEALAEAFKEFQERVMSRALEEMEKGVLEEEQGRVVKKGKAERYLCTRFGWIRYERQKVRYLEEGGKRYGFPLDEALGLRPHQQETDWVRRRGVEAKPGRSEASPLHRGWGEMDQRDSRGRLLEECLSTRLVALSEEAEGGSEGRREVDRGVVKALEGGEGGGTPSSSEAEANDGPGRGGEAR